MIRVCDLVSNDLNQAITHLRCACCEGATELLAARCMALLHMLAEYEEPPFLDGLQPGLSTGPMSRQLADRLCAHAGAQQQLCHLRKPGDALLNIRVEVLGRS